MRISLWRDNMGGLLDHQINIMQRFASRALARPKLGTREERIMVEHTAPHAVGLEPKQKYEWPADVFPKIDPSLLLAMSLFSIGDADQLFLATGIRLDKPDQFIPLLIELDSIELERSKMTAAEAIKMLADDDIGLDIPGAYITESETNPGLRNLAARKSLQPLGINAIALQDWFVKLLASPNIKRVALAGPYQPFKEHNLGGSLPDIGLPADRRFTENAGKPFDLDGEGVVIGIVDDGCAFAHQNFLTRKVVGNKVTYESRILYLWDQTSAAQAPTNAWKNLPDFSYGYELTGAKITGAVKAHTTADDVIEEDKVYEELNYKIGEIDSHGTHVMDIAAGNGNSLMGSEGVACGADIIFVQLPTDLIEEGGRALFDKILHGALYVFARAGKKRAVVNISYGAFAGPHDGTSLHESGIDDLLAVTDRAVVLAAGNGFEADCHATETLEPGQREALQWIVLPEDPTLNIIDIWYNKDANLDIYVTRPGESIALGPVTLGTNFPIPRAGGTEIVGWVFHSKDDPGNHDNHILIALLPTIGEYSVLAGNAVAAPAPSGTWNIGLKNVGQIEARFDAWIERDPGSPGGTRRRQSRFAAEDAYPGGTLSNLAACKLALSVGAYNTATQEVCRYSACGPTRPINGDPKSIRRNKPEVCAPAEEDAACRGILSASSLSAEPTRMNGTSAAAPHVTGLVALMLRVAKDKGKSLTAVDIRNYVVQGAINAAGARAPLNPNRHQDADDHRPIKQEDVWSDLTGAGRINVIETIKLV
jgi:subtilisin family serine protease